jgi:hypothetical protein
LSGQTANIGAVPVKFDAPHHHFDVWFAQTGCRALFARGDAFIAGFDTTFVLFRWHNVSPFLFCLFLYQRTSRSQNLSTHVAPGNGFAMGHYRGLWGDAAPPKTDPAESCLSSPGRKTSCASGDATRTNFVFTNSVLRTPSRSQLVLTVLIETFSLRRGRSLFKTAQLEPRSIQRPVVKKRINQEEIDKLPGAKGQRCLLNKLSAMLR